MLPALVTAALTVRDDAATGPAEAVTTTARAARATTAELVVRG
jgi:hypothetical protein